MVPLQHQHLTVDGEREFMILQHALKDLSLDLGLLGHPHHLHHPTNIAVDKSWVVTVGGLHHG